MSSCCAGSIAHGPVQDACRQLAGEGPRGHGAHDDRRSGALRRGLHRGRVRSLANPLPHAAWERLHTPVLDDHARGWVRVARDWADGPVLWHNGSNTMWYALLMLQPASDTVLAFATNGGAIGTAETAFVELARELGGPAPAS